MSCCVSRALRKTSGHGFAKCLEDSYSCYAPICFIVFAFWSPRRKLLLNEYDNNTHSSLSPWRKACSVSFAGPQHSSGLGMLPEWLWLASLTEPEWQTLDKGLHGWPLLAVAVTEMPRDSYWRQSHGSYYATFPFGAILEEVSVLVAFFSLSGDLLPFMSCLIYGTAVVGQS